MNDARFPVPSLSIGRLSHLSAAVLLGCATLSQALPAQSPSADREVSQAKSVVTTKPAVPTAAQLLAKATLRAAKENKRVLVLEGSLEPADAVELQASLKRDRKLSRTILYEYELLARATKGKLELLILNAKGKEVARSAAEAFTKDGGIAQKKLDAWLQEHKAKPLHARKVLADALAFAKEHNKNVFVHLGAPW